MKKNKQMKMTLSEASDYFDEHDIFELDDAREVNDLEIKLKKKKYIGLDIELFNKVRRIAKKHHKSEDALIQEWLMEKTG